MKTFCVLSLLALGSLGSAQATTVVERSGSELGQGGLTIVFNPGNYSVANVARGSLTLSVGSSGTINLNQVANQGSNDATLAGLRLLIDPIGTPYLDPGAGSLDLQPPATIYLAAPSGYTSLASANLVSNGLTSKSLVVSFGAVPEPSTWLLMALACAVLVFATRRHFAA